MEKDFELAKDGVRLQHPALDATPSKWAWEAMNVKLSYRHGLPLVLLYRSLTTVDSRVQYLDGTWTVSTAFSVDEVEPC